MINNASGLILASSSQVRSKILKNAGVKFRVQPANIDEKKIKRASGDMPAKKLARKLSIAKAQEVSKKFSNQMVIGADQILECDGVLFDKPLEYKVARRTLLKLQGKTHQLISSECIVLEGKIIWSHTDRARLTMLNLNTRAVDQYLEKAGNSVYSCVGAYRLQDPRRLLKPEAQYFVHELIASA